jgi:nucleotide-binding universal stress UspA family protein
MYSSILWATDGSPEADGALREALELLEPGGLLVAYHCDQRFSGSRVSGQPVVADEVDRQRHIEEQVDELRESGVNVEHLVESTHHGPSREIPAIAAELDVDAIVCGTRGPHSLYPLLSGSVAAGILRHSAVPVIVVPAKASICHHDAAAI